MHSSANASFAHVAPRTARIAPGRIEPGRCRVSVALSIETRPARGRHRRRPHGRSQDRGHALGYCREPSLGKSSPMKLIIQIPCFNEADQLPQTLADLPREVTGFDVVEWLVIDDRSNQETLARARAHGGGHLGGFTQ